MIISEVLDAIDNINSITIESAVSMCESLLSSYDKMSLLEEYYEGDDINGFKIFQEAQTESPKKNQGIFRTIINAIKTLFKAIAQYNLIINKISGNKQFISDMNYKMSGNENKNAAIKARDAFDAMEQSRENKKNEEKDKKIKEQNELLANMRSEFAKFVGETGYKTKQQKKSVKNKREELFEEYKKKGLVVDDNVNYDDIFGEPENYVEAE